MTETQTRTFEAALALPAEARAELVDRLLASLHGPEDPEIQRLWVEEAQRRDDEIERGEAELIDAEIVLDEIQRKYGL